MDKSTFLSNGILNLLLNAEGIPGLADNAVGGNTELFLALHTGDPGVDGDQATNEVGYDGYARVSVVRDGTGWTVVGNTASPTDHVEFGEMTGGSEGEATHASIGMTASGTGEILYKGALNPVVKYSLGSVPRIKDSSTIKEV